MPAFPRTPDKKLRPSEASRPEGMRAASLVAQRGSAQTRDVQAMGVGWREKWNLLRSGDPDVEAMLALIKRHARNGNSIWVDHPTKPGMGRPPNGTGEENLLRDAAMDTDTDGDGVVDGFRKEGDDAAATFSLDGTAGAQKISVDGTQTSKIFPRVDQTILRVFPGDEIVFSMAVKAENLAGGSEGALAVDPVDADGNLISGHQSRTNFTQTSFGRVVVSFTAPSGEPVVGVDVSLQYRGTSGGGDGGDIFGRDARLLRASSDPATWSNPHVSGGSQTGDTLDTSGWPASTSNVVRAGDMIRLGGSGSSKLNAEADEMIRVFEVAADADSDGSGNATIEIDPPILSGNTPPDGAALRLQSVRARTFIRDYTIPSSQGGALLRNTEVRFREAI